MVEQSNKSKINKRRSTGNQSNPAIEKQQSRSLPQNKNMRETPTQLPSPRDGERRTRILSKSCRMTDDRLCGAGERTAPSTGHHTSPELVREITSPTLVVSAPRTLRVLRAKTPIRPPVEPSRHARSRQARPGEDSRHDSMGRGTHK